jgi:hypothetical protein
LGFEGAQYLEQGPLLQAQVAPAVNQLIGLGNEFHFANATRAQLDIFGHALAPHLLLDQLLHGAQRIDGGKIQIAAVHEGPQQAEQLSARGLVAGHDPGLDHGVAFPVAALILVILFEGIEAEYQGPRRAVGAQAHVDAKDEAVDGDRVQRLDQPLAQADEEFLVVQRALGAFGLAAFGVGENQVDVRRQVQFDGAELAHAEHDHLLSLAAAPALGGAELLAQARVKPAIRLVDAGIGHVREVAAGFHQVGLPGQIAPDDAYLLAGALTAQLAPQLLLVVDLGKRRGELCAELAGVQRPLQFAAGVQGDQ